MVASHVAPLPTVLIEAHRFDAVDRDAYWSGDDSVLTRYGARDGLESTSGNLHTLVISIHPELRESWLVSRDMG